MTLNVKQQDAANRPECRGEKKSQIRQMKWCPEATSRAREAQCRMEKNRKEYYLIESANSCICLLSLLALQTSHSSFKYSINNLPLINTSAS
ncbi:Gluconolactonase [Fusarium oxysporum f. sp. albedinis]|nr:Gluconolactonase [Fusarium oxysporum f. sp. albedinis]